MKLCSFALLLLFLCNLPAFAQSAKPAGAAQNAVSFQRDVLPIFRTACVGCHNAQSPASGLSLASFAETMKGGRGGVDVTPGTSAKSRLVQMLIGTVKPQMPPGGMLKSSDIDAIRRWIDAGAKPDALIPEKIAGGRAPMKVIAAATTTSLVYKPLGTWRKAAAPVNALAFSPDGKTLAIGTYRRVLLCDPATRQIIKIWSGHADAVRTLAFTDDGKLLAAGSGNAGAFGEARIWNVAQSREVRTLGDHTDVVNAVAFSPDGTRLATGSTDKMINVWEIGTGKRIQTLRDHADAVLGLAWRPDGKYLASCSADKNVKIWDTASWKRLYSLPAHDDIITDVAFSPNGAQLLTASADHSVKIWNFGPENSGQVRRLDGHSHTVWEATVSSDGKLAATASADKTVKLWNFDNGGNRATFADAQDWVYAVRFSPDHKRLAAGTWDGTVYLWNVETLKLEGSLSTSPTSSASTATKPLSRAAKPVE